MNNQKIYLASRLSGLSHLDAATIDYMVSLVKELKVKKHTVFFQVGDVSEYMYFISRGLVMQRYCDGNYEKAISFHFEGDFFTCYESFLNGTPSEFCLHALEGTLLLYWEKDDYEHFLATQTNATLASLEFVQTLFFKEYKIKSRLLTYSAEKLYNHIINNEPDIIRRVPLTYIAEYMGITNEYLSRLRKKIRDT